MQTENNPETENSAESQADTSVEQAQQTSSSSNQIAAAKENKVRETKVYDEGYVKNLREEAATYRVRAKTAEEKAADFENRLAASEEKQRVVSLKSAVGLAARDLKIIDPDAAMLLLDKDALKFNDETSEYEGVEDALKNLIEAKPYLVGSVQAATKPTNPPRKPLESSNKDLKSALTAYYNK